jgi:hypothetical protein
MSICLDNFLIKLLNNIPKCLGVGKYDS